MCTCEADGDQMLRRWRKRTNEGRGDPHATDDGVGYVSTPSSPHIGGHGINTDTSLLDDGDEMGHRHLGETGPQGQTGFLGLPQRQRAFIVGRSSARCRTRGRSRIWMLAQMPWAVRASFPTGFPVQRCSGHRNDGEW
jgi:hypothetical protein